MDAAAPFSPAITPALCDDASRVFVRAYLARRYGVLLLACMAINVTGITIASLTGGNSPLVDLFAVVVVVMPAVYFTAYWFRQPSRLSAGMQRRLNPATLCKVDADGVTFMEDDRGVTIAWSRVKATLERPSYFLCVLSPMSFFVVPTASMPAQAETLLRERVAPRASDAATVSA
jgi:hypothetical protein